MAFYWKLNTITKSTERVLDFDITEDPINFGELFLEVWEISKMFR